MAVTIGLKIGDTIPTSKGDLANVFTKILSFETYKEISVLVAYYETQADYDDNKPSVSTFLPSRPNINPYVADNTDYQNAGEFSNTVVYSILRDAMLDAEGEFKLTTVTKVT